MSRNIRRVGIASLITLGIASCGNGNEASQDTTEVAATTPPPDTSNAPTASSMDAPTTPSTNASTTSEQATVLTPATVPSTSSPPTQCDSGPPPFAATFLPKDFSNQLLAGNGGQITIGSTGSISTVGPPQPGVYHYAGPPGRFINIQRNAMFRPLTTEPITVLGRPAEVGSIEDGYTILFSVGDGDCGLYSMNAYGVSLDDFKSVGSGLTLNE